MESQREVPYSTIKTEGLSVSALKQLLRQFAVQDYFVIGYCIALNLATLNAPTAELRTQSFHTVFPLLLIALVSVVLIRGGAIKNAFVAALLYRMAIYGTVQISYFLFHRFLPAINPGSLDPQLYDLDMSIFGFEPAMLMDTCVSPLLTEWFAFFYFGYFFLLALHVLPILFLGKHPRILGEFTLGMILLFCTGHLIYMLVPGWGPYSAMPDAFQNPLPGGAWLDMVMATVASGGAQKDIFPSLHTAAPTFLMLFSFRNRERLPYRFTWPVVAFFTCNIVIATMYLRWHYVIDVVAGLLLATGAFLLTCRLTRHELKRRRRHGLMPNWPEFFPAPAAADTPSLSERA